MPVEVKYLDNKIGVVLTIAGEINGKEIIEAVNNFYQSENFKINNYGIVELSCSGRDNLTNSDIKAIADLSIKASIIGPERIIAVVARSDVNYGLSRMWEILAEKTNWETRVFRSRSDAEGWLIGKAMEKFNLDVNLK